jgi:hypothetical protein
MHGGDITLCSHQHPGERPRDPLRSVRWACSCPGRRNRVIVEWRLRRFKGVLQPSRVVAVSIVAFAGAKFGEVRSLPAHSEEAAICSIDRFQCDSILSPPGSSFRNMAENLLLGALGMADRRRIAGLMAEQAEWQQPAKTERPENAKNGLPSHSGCGFLIRESRVRALEGGTALACVGTQQARSRYATAPARSESCLNDCLSPAVSSLLSPFRRCVPPAAGRSGPADERRTGADRGRRLSTLTSPSARLRFTALRLRGSARPRPGGKGCIADRQENAEDGSSSRLARCRYFA